MPAITTAIAAALIAAGGSGAPADPAADAWTVTLVQPAGQAPAPTPVVVRQPAPRRAPSRSVVRRAATTWRPTTTCQHTAGTWTVRPGDTLTLVSRCTGASVARIARASGLADPDMIRVGAVLTIPGDVR